MGAKIGSPRMKFKTALQVRLQEATKLHNDYRPALSHAQQLFDEVDSNFTLHQFKGIGQKLADPISTFRSPLTPFTQDFLVMDPKSVKNKYGEESTLDEIGIVTNSVQQLVTSVDDERVRLLYPIKVYNTEHKSKANANVRPAKKTKTRV